MDQGPTQEPSSQEGGTGTILLVDDHLVVLRVTARILERLGYTVIRAESAEEALELYRALPRRPDLVLTDVMMPGLSGPELAAELRAGDPTLPVLFTSGFVGQELESAAGGPPEPLLPKPFTLEELALHVRQVMSRSSG